MAVLTPVYYVISQSVDAGIFLIDWNALKLAAISGLFGYLTKNFFTAPDVKKTAE